MRALSPSHVSCVRQLRQKVRGTSLVDRDDPSLRPVASAARGRGQVFAEIARHLPVRREPMLVTLRQHNSRDASLFRARI